MVITYNYRIFCGILKSGQDKKVKKQLEFPDIEKTVNRELIVFEIICERAKVDLSLATRCFLLSKRRANCRCRKTETVRQES